MKRSGAHAMRVLLVCAVFAGAPLLVGLAAPNAVHAQGGAKISSQQLDSLAAPIALYPDALLAQVLMASTFPQAVQAAAIWSRANSTLQGDSAVKAVASEPWDPSVQSLVAFPQVLATMASKADWVTQLGSAFLAQPGDVMDSVQRLRRQAQAAGNLKTTSQQTVVVEQSTIQIVPANPQVVYVPTYNPTVVYGVWPYPAYPPVYVPPPPGYVIGTSFFAGLAFGAGIAVANALWGGFDWHSHDVNINVNRYNNINVHNRLDVNGRTTNWNRNADVNRNIGGANVNRGLNNVGSAQRDAYRARDDARARAQHTLQSRTGQNLGGSASQRVQGIHHGGTANVDLQKRAQNVNRDNALRSAGDGNAARQDARRGQTSRDALAGRGGQQHASGANGDGLRRTSGGPGANGGDPQQRASGGLGANGGGVQRSGGTSGGGGGGGLGGGDGGRALGGGGAGEHHLGRGR
ncbi:DUF3300 domain-containing protein [Paraburkholderia sp. BL6669N2]|uniref:DUF3300 domain-containing protein n=1 Tax=Paraburkholderia sp. BL6669N2 TaxID=1938807 RepID=UPI000E22C03A|nr:DUF3300 domain-containing protein [Paraburkholderia sp. BL6669N2]